MTTADSVVLIYETHDVPSQRYKYQCSYGLQQHPMQQQIP